MNGAELQAVSAYLWDAITSDDLWCECGDAILLDAPYCDPIYFDRRGQYCCPVCAELKYWRINGLPNRYGVLNDGGGSVVHNGSHAPAKL